MPTLNHGARDLRREPPRVTQSKSAARKGNPLRDTPEPIGHPNAASPAGVP
jgi:hypothetical protein